MRINKVEVDLFKFVFVAVAVILAVAGQVSWWTILLIVLFGIELKLTVTL